MSKVRFARSLFVFWSACLACAHALAAAPDYPAKPVRVILPYAPGGDMDRLARLLTEKLRDKWGQSVVLENFGGAGGNIGAAMVHNAAPDGYTLLFGATAQVVTNKLLYSKLDYDPDNFTPISLVSTSSNVLVANPKVPIDDVPQLIAYAKAHPGKLSYVSGGVGTSTHLATELFSSAAGIKLLHVPYKSSSMGLTDVVAGNVDLGFFTPGLIIKHVQTGRLKLIAVGSSGPNPLFPGVKPVADTVPGVMAGTWYAFVAPPHTPADIAQKISAAVADILKQPDVVRTMADLNIEPIGSTPAEMKTFVDQERQRWGEVIRSNHIKAE